MNLTGKVVKTEETLHRNYFEFLLFDQKGRLLLEGGGLQIDRS